jgi:hypothetical protein
MTRQELEHQLLNLSTSDKASIVQPFAQTHPQEISAAILANSEAAEGLERLSIRRDRPYS